MPSRSPAAGRYPVPGPHGSVLRHWDGQTWSDHYEAGPGTPLPGYHRRPLRAVAFPGWLLVVAYVAALAASAALAHLEVTTPVRAGLAVSIAVATAAPAVALLVLFDRRLAFGQLRGRGGLVAWGIASGAASAVIAVLVVYAVSGEWHAPLVSAPFVPSWLVAVLQGGLKMVVPILLWAYGAYRVPREGFLLVLVSALSFAVFEAAIDGWATAEIDRRRGGAVLLTVLLSALVAAVPWRAAWRRSSIVTWPAVVALATAIVLHGAADLMIVNDWWVAACVVALLGYLAVKVTARQLVPPDMVAEVSPGWRPEIGTLLSPDTPLLSPTALRTWLHAPGGRARPAALVSFVGALASFTRILVRGLAALVALVAVAAVIGALVVAGLAGRNLLVQRSLDPFYATPSDLPTRPGTLIRTEPLTAGFSPLVVAGGRGYRMLYTTARPDGTVAPAGGMVFVPDTPATDGPRPILAWAHPTLGEGEACAPSRSGNPLLDMQPWLTLALQRGWVVVATDYQGVGTDGTPMYLVGEAEARDVAYSAEAVGSFAAAQAGTKVAVFGHSQGGHSALWTGALASSLTPDLHVVGVAAAAPAAELAPVFDSLWDGSQAWLLSPDVVESWTSYYRGLPDRVLTPLARAIGPAQSRACIYEGVAQSELLYRLGIRYNVRDPLRVPGWPEAALRQTPAPLPSTLPVLLVQSTSDQTIPGWTNGLLQKTWCAAGSQMDAIWLSGVSHIDTATTASPAIVDWLQQRFDGQPTTSTCDIPPPATTPEQQALVS